MIQVTSEIILEPCKAIGILDSGVGGLTVVKEFYRQLPRENIVYFGDTARMPYGPRSHQEVRSFALEIIEFLQTQEVKMVVVACNSATAAGISYYQERLDIPVIGVIEPGARAALKATRNGRIRVIGTTGTVGSGAYEKDLRQMDSSVQIFSRACPLLVLIVENNLVSSAEAYRVAEEYLYPLKEEQIDTLILGCTHYPLLAPLIQEVMGEEVTLISSAEEIAREAKDFFATRNLLNPLNPVEGNSRFFVSGKPAMFEEIGDKLLKKKIKVYQVVF